MTAPEPFAANEVSRTHLLLAHLNLVNELGNADTWLRHNHVDVIVGAAACRSSSAQAAAMTAVTLASRASLTIHAALEDPEAEVLHGHLRGMRLADALSHLGALDGGVTPSARCLLLGEPVPPDGGGLLCLQATWQGWVAALRSPGIRLAEDDDNVLAAITAAALAVSELFHGLLGNLEAGWREVTCSLWDPLSLEPCAATGPALNFLPLRWALVGLGHLGQAAAWCISHLPYEEGRGELWLIDDDTASASNVSTGVMTEPGDATARTRKTRLVGSCLERSGRPTRLWESRLPVSYRHEIGHPDVALIGVDNARTRLALSDVDWPLCVDTGLGSTPSSFSSFALHVFPGAYPSSRVASWQGKATPIDEGNLSPAFEHLIAQSTVDRCGAVLLAGRVVAAAFVGVMASCFAVAEPLRRIHGGQGVDVLTLELQGVRPRGATATGKSARIESTRAIRR